MSPQVLTGYFGPLPGGLLQQLGRGYSDLCAALAAVGTKAKELQVGSSSHSSCIQESTRYKMADWWIGLEGSVRRLHCVNTAKLIQSSVSPRLTIDSDPSKVPTAKLLSLIDPREANELTHVYTQCVINYADHFTASMAPK